MGEVSVIQSQQLPQLILGLSSPLIVGRKGLKKYSLLLTDYLDNF